MSHNLALVRSPWLSGQCIGWLIVLVLLSGGRPYACGQTEAAERIDFNRDIRPLLSNHCFRCHGPDADERGGGGAEGLRLDTPAGLAEDLGGYSAVVPGQPEASELLNRVTSDDDSVLMPPPGSGQKLTAVEVDLLRRWIAEGAVYAIHWSYVAPQRPPVPDLPDESARAWAQNPIDHFIWAGLQTQQLRPQTEADRHALIRRVALDVTGLPPNSEEVEAFVQDDSPQAYERMVDRFLAKETYGEHWARLWLDLARYADSAGYADDPPRTIWAYRDYVIRAFNQNKSFQQFTIEQLAGDLLPDPTPEQWIATAFHRNTLTNNEGGTNDEEFRNVAVVDRVNTTYAVWMGTTMACAQCHTHKYDPLTHAEYFQSFAIFNGTEDADRSDEKPVFEVWQDSARQKRRDLEQSLAADQAMLNRMTPELEQALQTWLAELPDPPEWQTPPILSASSEVGSELEIQQDAHTIRSLGSAAHDTFAVELELPNRDAATGALVAVQLEALADDSLPGRGPGWSGGNFVLSEVLATLLPPESRPSPGQLPNLDGARQVSFTAAFADYSQPGFEAARLVAQPLDHQKGWAVGGQLGRDHQLTLVAAEPIDWQPGSRLRIELRQQSPHPQHLLGKFRLRVTTDPTVRRWAELPADIQTIARSAASARTTEQSERLASYFRSITPLLADLRQRVASAQAELAALQPMTTVPIMRELPSEQRRVTRIHNRGNFLDLGDEVQPGIPAVFQPGDVSIHDRLELARWLVSRENPLTARVTVNRYWEQLFGAGLVATSEEFGTQGDRPTHPELLDWLAVEFMDQGWDMKQLLRTLLLSATYRQSSQVRPEVAQADPENRWLSRGPRFRLSAEMIRDQALAVAGLLSDKRYGPPVKPPQPTSGLSAAFGSSTDWQTSSGEDRYRRGLYTTWRRSNPYPSLSTFDAPNREVCTLRRMRTNTPLQALVTLNDPVYIEAAQALGRRIAASEGTLEQKLAAALEGALVRPARAGEIVVLQRLYEQAFDALQDQPAEALELATNPLGPLPTDADAISLAAWTVVCNAILNLDEFLMRR